MTWTPVEVGERLVKWRKLRRLTQKDVAILAGISHNTVFLYESGRSAMSMERFLWVLEALEVTPERFFGTPPPKEKKVVMRNVKERLDALDDGTADRLRAKADRLRRKK